MKYYVKILENDDRWQEFDEELTEVALELSELLFDSLITEILTDIVPVQLTQKLRSTHWLYLLIIIRIHFIFCWMDNVVLTLMHHKSSKWLW